MSNQDQLDFCKSCQSKTTGSFCSNCGQPQRLKRIDSTYILSEIGNVLNFNKGIFYTIRELLLRPGLNIQQFLHKERNRLMKPIIFVIICSLIYSVARQFLHFEDGYVDYQSDGISTTLKLSEWVQSNYGYANILMAFFIGFWIQLFFKKYNYNIFEVLVLLCFVMGMNMLIYAIFGTLESITDLKILNFGGMIGLAYSSWAIGEFFGKEKKMNFVKALISYMLGMLSFFLSLMLLGNFIDFFLK